MSQIPQTSGTVLVVDDVPTNLDILSCILRDAGLKVLVARSGESALQKATRAQPDLILLDIMMPHGIDGFETCRRLKKDPRATHIPIVFMTALSDVRDKILGFSLGAVDYITKPFQCEEVIARTQLHLKLSQFSRQLEEQKVLLEKRVEERTSELNYALIDLQATRDRLLKQEARLRYDAYHDSLTHLPNRVWLMEKIAQFIDRPPSTPSFALLFLDLDRFKAINDSWGHIVGDELLGQVAQRLQKSLPEGVEIARFGGDEFAIVLPEVNLAEDAVGIARHIQEQFHHPFHLSFERQVFVSGSIGITIGNANYQHSEEVLRDADIAMYRAKKSGEGSFVLFNPQMQSEARMRLELENALRGAIARRELTLHYQPIVSLLSGKIKGFEALARWHSTELNKSISPEDFIPIAEETGLIHDLGIWVLEEACAQAKRWSIDYPHIDFLVLHVNLSVVQLLQVDLVENVERALQHIDRSRCHLKLEITEGCLLDSGKNVEPVLQALKSLGVLLCVDDFGTGYSSLHRLHTFPIDTLKLDRAFVSRIHDLDCDVEFVRAILMLARSLGIDVVAEGVETPTQVKALQILGCEAAQGFYFSEPIDTPATAQLLAAPNRFRSLLSQVESPARPNPENSSPLRR